MNEQQLRAQIADDIRKQLTPRCDIHSYEGGYDCCGCSTYNDIVDHAVLVALGQPLPPLADWMDP